MTWKTLATVALTGETGHGGRQVNHHLHITHPLHFPIDFCPVHV